MLAQEIAASDHISELPSDGHPPRHPSPTWTEARQIAFDCALPLAPVELPLSSAAGHKLTRDVAALQTLPHYDSSAMDGWAVNGSGPWVLTGQGYFLSPGHASVIATGGLIPAGAQSILRKENGEIHHDADGLPLLKLNNNAKHGEPGPGRHIRPAGEEAVTGEVLIPAGTTLNPGHIALAAAAGHDSLQVQPRPVVGVVLTGSEVSLRAFRSPARSGTHLVPSWAPSLP